MNQSQPSNIRQLFPAERRLHSSSHMGCDEPTNTHRITNTHRDSTLQSSQESTSKSLAQQQQQQDLEDPRKLLELRKTNSHRTKTHRDSSRQSSQEFTRKSLAQEEDEEEDLEDPRKLLELRKSSHKLSMQLASQTELSTMNLSTPCGNISGSNRVSPPPSASSLDSIKGNRKRKWNCKSRLMRSTCCLAQEHGGDYATRTITALRVALGSGVTFASLVIPEATAELGVVWVGHIWYHVNIATSLGASVPKVFAFGKSIVLVSLVSWPVAYGLTFLEKEWIASIVFPIAIFFLSLIIMTSPQITSNSLMLVVMYIIVALPFGVWVWWKPVAWIGTYFVCLAIAVLVNIFPFPNLALNKTCHQLERFEKDITMLLLSTKIYSNNNGTNVKRARQAISTIEFMSTRIAATIASLKAELPATKVELRLLRWCGGAQAGRDLEAWIQQAERLLDPLQQLRSAVMQKVLGEGSNSSSPELAEAKVVLNGVIGSSRDRLIDAMVASIAVSHAWAHPSERRNILPNVKTELRQALLDCEHSFHLAICNAAHHKMEGASQREQTPLFAHLTRRMASFHAIFAVAESLLRYLENHDRLEDDKQGQNMEGRPKRKCCNPVRQKLSSYKTFCLQRWKWHSKDDRRMALKTALGMVFASFFVSMPYLKDMAAPYGTWPGITIAAVNQSTTGSSFHKAVDRLMATMIAGAFSLIVADFLDNDDVFKTVALTIFTFVTIYLRNAEHAYMYTYACISVGIMLFGSAKTDYDIEGYVPQRIELIFIGIIIFVFTELLLFPRSSRKIVETTSLDFCMSMKAFFKQAIVCSEKLEVYVNELKADSKHGTNKAVVILNESKDPFQLNVLYGIQSKLKAQSDTLCKEIDSAIAEPSLGMGQPLHAESFRRLVTQQRNSERQAALLCNTISKLVQYNQQEGHPMRGGFSTWPHVHRVALQEASGAMDSICCWLESVFPDGRIRAQERNSVKAVNAASTFRSLEDIREKIVLDWSGSFEDVLQHNGFQESDPEALMLMKHGIITTIILEICRYMQDAGKSIEEIAYHFPTFQ
eukprot:CAMPEP_0113601440 /NCGR_PEP_ID=MMETSP0017_2-20120614/230_1 /TAXON_ID=2856 /ORGANISM="Cylindrotheca closterium" /LENGTH=1049 /DNA_ID=CAMNT_0000509733 /DNA_START=94 /DNA_END=3243 /DNA_ORIENTATION=- /assembly_acc=CAM_ASM_000147